MYATISNNWTGALLLIRRNYTFLTQSQLKFEFIYTYILEMYIHKFMYITVKKLNNILQER